PQMRRRLPPCGRSRGAPDRRAARPDARSERRGDAGRTRLLQPIREARADRLDVRGLRRPPYRATPRGERAPHLRADDYAPVGLRRVEGDGRISRARVPPGARTRLRDRAALQPRRPAAERAIRAWDPALR